MNAHGTIDRPRAHEPAEQETTMSPSTDYPAARHEAGAYDERQNRNLEMQLMPEALARAQYRDRVEAAERERRAMRLIAARRMQRRAERAHMRARRALAMAVMQ
ncbi:hypothetical protein [Streptomyces sp. 184]|uniref:hypothetical protein n=1 Tax=Streptomyces sp. 184 TaxID=1827526 RepID=UPI003892849C